MTKRGVWAGALVAPLWMATEVAGVLAPPSPWVFAEAEACKRSDRGWSVLACPPKQLDTPSGGGLLIGDNAERGDAIARLVVPTAGTYRVWIRVATTRTPNFQSSIYRVSLVQDGKTVASQTFDRARGASVVPQESDVLDELSGKPKPPPFVWDGFAADLRAGVADMKLEKVRDGRQVMPAPALDCIYATTNSAVQPPPLDEIAPLLYARVVLPADATVPLTLGGGGRSGDWKTRVALGRFGKVDPAKPGYLPIRPGESSAWVNLSEQSNYNRDWMLYEFGPEVPKSHVGPVRYTLQFSTMPHERGVFDSVAVSGRTPRVSMWMNIGERDTATDWECARLAAAKVAALPAARGKRPVKFPVATAICVGGLSENVIDQEMRTVAGLGFNSFGLGSGDQLFIDYGAKYGYTFLDAQQFGRLGNPAQVQAYAEHLRTNTVYDKVPFVSLADEPGCNFDGYVASDPECVAGFAGFLKARGVTPAELGLESLAEAKPAHYPENNDPLHYWSMRYYTYSLGGRFRATTAALRDAGLRSGANFACQIVGNVAWNGANWFELYRDGDLTYGWTEDWFNMCSTYQFVGFQMAVMRAACKPAGVPYGTYCIIGNRTPWDVGAKAFSQLARKLDAFKVFNYGPSYANADSFNNRDTNLFQAVRDVNFAIGAIEDSYMQSQPAKGDVAMLYSSTSDLWNMQWHNWFPSSLPGLERSTLYMLLGQCGIRADILHESDLRTELPKWKAFFAVDSHIHADYVDAIVAWVKEGGTLYLGANALAFDHYNRPTGIEAKLGIRRGSFQLQSVPGILEGGIPDSVGQVSFADASIPILYGVQEVSGELLASRADGQPAVSSVACGKGRVILCGFYPGLSHFKRASHNKAVHFQSLSIYPGDTRALMRAILDRAGATSLIRSDNPMIEAHLLEAPDRDIVVLSNWTGAPCKTRVTVAGHRYTRAVPVRGEVASLETGEIGSALVISVGSGDFIECFK